RPPRRVGDAGAEGKRGMTKRRLAMRLFPLILVLLAGRAVAADVTVEISGIANNKGDVVTGLCTVQEFLKPCARRIVLAAAPGTMSATFSGVEPGRYAVQAFHDANHNGKLDTDTVGAPVEGYGFSNDVTTAFGPPQFTDAAFELGAEDKKIRLRLSYVN